MFFVAASNSWIYGDFKKNKCVKMIKKGLNHFAQEIIGDVKQSIVLKKITNYVDVLTNLDVYTPPFEREILINQENHNFYLDLSIQSLASSSNNNNNNNTKRYLSDVNNPKKAHPQNITLSLSHLKDTDFLNMDRVSLTKETATTE